MSLEREAELVGHSGKVWSVSWSPDGRALASCGEDKSVRIWMKQQLKESWSCVAVLSGVHERTIRRVSWSPNSKYLACCGFDGNTSIWMRASSGDYECVASLEGHENEVKAVHWSACGTLLATCGRDKSIWIWEVGEVGEFECVSVLHGHSQDVKSVRWHPTNQVLFSCSYDDSIKVWVEEDMDWFCASTLSQHASTVWDLAFDREGSRFVSCSDDKTLMVWARDRDREIQEGKECELWQNICTLSGYHARPIYSVSFSSSGAIASGCGDNAIRIFLQDESAPDSYGMELVVEEAHAGDVNCVAFHPEEELLTSCGDDQCIRIWKFSPSA